MVTVKRNSIFCDEFYTQYETIEKELRHYNFKGKCVYCNCYIYSQSNFFTYFFKNFKQLGLRRLICTGLQSIVYVDVDPKGANAYDTKVIPVQYTAFDSGSFDSEKSLQFLDECDVVVTNPPFSKWREFYNTIKHKDFIILGNYNIIRYPEIFEDIINGKLHFGYNVNQSVKFIQPDGSLSKSVPSITWFTSFKRNIEPLRLTRNFNPYELLDQTINNYKYKGQTVINCNKLSDIPVGYGGVIAVPITFLSKWNPEQFEVLGYSPYYNDKVKRLEHLYDNCIEYNINNEPTGRKGNKIVTPVICSTRKFDNCNYFKEINVHGSVTGRYMKVLDARIFIKLKNVGRRF